MAVGCGGLEHRLRIVGDMEEDAVEIIPRLFGRDREARLVNDLLERLGGQLERRRQFALGDDREIVPRQRRAAEARAARDDRPPAFGGGEIALSALGGLAGGLGGAGGRERGCRYGWSWGGG